MWGMGLLKSQCSHPLISMTTSGTTSGWKGTWKRHLFKWISSYRRLSLLPLTGTSFYSSTVSSSWVSSAGRQLVTELYDVSAEVGQNEVIPTDNNKALFIENLCSGLCQVFYFFVITNLWNGLTPFYRWTNWSTRDWNGLPSEIYLVNET